MTATASTPERGGLQAQLHPVDDGHAQGAQVDAAVGRLGGPVPVPGAGAPRLGGGGGARLLGGGLGVVVAAAGEQAHIRLLGADGPSRARSWLDGGCTDAATHGAQPAQSVHTGSPVASSI